MLTPEQQTTLDDVLEGHSIFLTGDAGTGKSFLINEIVEKNPRLTAVTAMTGSAALLINGSTLHSFLGIGLAKEPVEKLVQTVRRYPGVRERIIDTKTLIIDEASMMSDGLFEKVDAFLRLLRRCPNKPFGGLQVILVGDPFQLCPIEGSYFFTSPLWAQFEFKRHNLTTNMRQKDDPLFKEILDCVRFGGCTPEHLVVLEGLKGTQFPEGIQPTRLYSKNVSVDNINQTEMTKLLGSGAQSQLFELFFSNEKAQKWVQANKIPVQVLLCTGAQVMCTRNMPALGLANGSRGIITSLGSGGVWFKKLNGVTVHVPLFDVPFENPGTRVTYLPIKLAWALTIHSAQGMTIDALEVDLGQDIFTWGQAYTGLSRATSLSAVRVTNVLAKSFVTHPIVLELFNTPSSSLFPLCTK